MPATAFEVATLPLDAAVKAVRHGLPAGAFNDLARVLSLSSGVLARKLGIPTRTLSRKRERGVRLSTELSEKLVRTARIQMLARKVFTTDVAVSEWLALPAPALHGAAPIDMIDTEMGAREVEALIQGIVYGNVM